MVLEEGGTKIFRLVVEFGFRSRLVEDMLGKGEVRPRKEKAMKRKQKLKTADRQIPPMNHDNRIVLSVQTDTISSRSSLQTITMLTSTDSLQGLQLQLLMSRQGIQRS